MKCFICGNTKKFKSLKGSICKTNNFLCIKCGLVFIPRTNKKIGEYYKQDGYFLKSPNIGLKEQFISKNLLIYLAEKRVDNIIKFGNIDFRKKKILDVGCAYGDLLYVIKKKYGAKVMGIEASSQTAKIGAKMFKIEIKPILLEELNIREKFDVIFCSHTLEHVSNPQMFLQLLKKLMHDKSILYLEVPNILKPSGGFDLNTFFYEEHIQTFSVYNLAKFILNNKLFVYNYSHAGFLKFLVTKHKLKLFKKIHILDSYYILNFLNNYKNGYSIFSYFLVFTGKLRYLIMLLWFKISDILPFD